MLRNVIHLVFAWCHRGWGQNQAGLSVVGTVYWFTNNPVAENQNNGEQTRTQKWAGLTAETHPVGIAVEKGYGSGGFSLKSWASAASRGSVVFC